MGKEFRPRRPTCPDWGLGTGGREDLESGSTSLVGSGFAGRGQFLPAPRSTLRAPVRYAFRSEREKAAVFWPVGGDSFLLSRVEDR